MSKNLTTAERIVIALAGKEPVMEGISPTSHYCSLCEGLLWSLSLTAEGHNGDCPYPAAVHLAEHLRRTGRAA